MGRLAEPPNEFLKSYDHIYAERMYLFQWRNHGQGGNQVKKFEKILLEFNEQMRFNENKFS